MHSDNPIALIIFLKSHTGIIESEPGSRFIIRIAQLNLSTVCLVAIRATIK
jgi:hypothetical protein